jgi:hypothetical protein
MGPPPKKKNYRRQNETSRDRFTVMFLVSLYILKIELMEERLERKKEEGRMRHMERKKRTKKQPREERNSKRKTLALYRVTETFEAEARLKKRKHSARTAKET